MSGHPSTRGKHEPARARITGRGVHLPPDVLSNADVAAIADPELLERFVRTSAWCGRRRATALVDAGGGPVEERRSDAHVFDEFLRERMGFKQRRVVSRDAILVGRPAETGIGSADLGVAAAHHALADAALHGDAIDLVICGSSTPDRAYPAMAVQIQHAVGADRAYGFDLLGACSSLLLGLAMAEGQIAAGRADRALVVAAEHFTAGVDYRDPATSFYWGDAAVALVVERESSAHRPGFELLETRCGSRYDENIRTTLGGLRSFRLLSPERAPRRAAAGDPDYPYFFQDGPRVYRDVVPLVASGVQDLLGRHGSLPGDLRRLMLHQASRVMVRAIAERVVGSDADPVRVPTNFERYGNTSSCGVGICIAEEEHLADGDLVAAAAFGAGYTWAATLMRWRT